MTSVSTADDQSQHDKSDAGSIPPEVPEDESLRRLGAYPIAEGVVVFGVWAPHAQRIEVVGSFNDWGERQTAMTREGDNWFAAAYASLGDEYKFRLHTEWGTFDRVDPRAVEVTNSIGNGIIVDRDAEQEQAAASGFLMDPAESLVIYELHIGTFGGTDGVSTFDDAVVRLDALRSLGVNCVEIMPSAEFAGDLSWGYNPAHPFAVGSAYGGRGGLHRFIEAAHERGIAVIVDVVFNHFGPSDLDLWRFDGWGEGDYGGIYFFNDDRAVTPWGNTRPDYGRREVRDYILDNARMWIEEFGADGLRFDMTLYMRSVDAASTRPIPEGWSLTQELNQLLHGGELAEGRRLLSIAEDLQQDSRLTRPVWEDGAGFSAQWSAEFVHPIRRLLISPNDCDRSAMAVADILQFSYNGQWKQRIVYTESHDEVANGQARVPSEINSVDAAGEYAAKRAGLGLMLMATCPGIPMLFQGQEFLRDGWFRDERPLDWSLAESNAGFVKLTSDLIRLRTGDDGRGPALRGPGIRVLHVDEAAGLIAWHRWTDGGVEPGRDAVIVANLHGSGQTDYRIGFPRPGRWSVVFNGDASHYGEQFGGHAVHDIEAENTGWHGMPQSGLVSVGRYSVTIYMAE